MVNAAALEPMERQVFVIKRTVSSCKELTFLYKLTLFVLALENNVHMFLMNHFLSFGSAESLRPPGPKAKFEVSEAFEKLIVSSLACAQSGSLFGVKNWWVLVILNSVRDERTK